MKFYDLSDLNHDPAIAQAMGNLVVAWSRAETALGFALAAVTSMDVNVAQQGYFRIPTFEARYKFIVEVLRHGNFEETWRGAMIRAVEKLAKLSSTRNSYIHGSWCVEGTSNKTVLFHLRVDGDGRRQEVKAADIKQHCEAVLGRVADLRELLPDAPWT
ncbi:MAG: hypothetical protein K2X11_14050 [Acetobacteraceae bacterium]|nr:hypothetical protein [Acetobacteraceae bacterium]